MAGATSGLDIKQLLAHLPHFSTTVRSSGSEAEAAAFAYAESVLAGYGYKTRLLKHDAFISLPGEATLKAGDLDIPCITHAMAAPTAALSGRLQYLTDRESEVNGNIALMDGLAEPGIVRSLVQRGAIGAVFINGEHTHEMILSPVWGSPDAGSLVELPGIPVVSVTSEWAGKLREVAASGGEVRLATQVDTGWRRIPLLEATLEAPDGDGSLILFSGHIDAWHLGAMDNGGANCTMLEVARVMAGRRSELKRSLRLLFWSGHSHGRYAGSAWYADEQFEELSDRALLHVNIDSVGGDGADVLSVAPSMTEAFSLVSEAIAAETGQGYEGRRMERSGDQSFFGHGVSSVFVSLSEQPPATGVAADGFAKLFGGGGRSGGLGWWWHTTEDTADKLDPTRLERDARVYLRVIHRACTAVHVPLEYSRTAREILLQLEQWRELAGADLDLGVAVARARELSLILEEFEAGLSDSAEASWPVLKAMARILVPLNYVAGSVYSHDPALPQPAVPALAGIQKLAATTDEAERKHLLVGLRRERNRVVGALREAVSRLTPPR